MLTGELKQRLIQVLQQLVADHQDKRSKVSCMNFSERLTLTYFGIKECFFKLIFTTALAI